VLSPWAQTVTVWETTYWQALSGAAPVLDWLRGTTLVPYLAPMSDLEREAFLAQLGARLAVAYPKDEQGRTLFPFRRVFLVAQR
ncbi:MAG TPA: trans-aconitate 2-methyltransferase, partial [Rhodocyclaceae bacterium]|nr:trans-aconitate 2-methyltransferase [Rhodocyclaceae bacterium]